MGSAAPYMLDSLTLLARWLDGASVHPGPVRAATFLTEISRTFAMHNTDFSAMREEVFLVAGIALLLAVILLLSGLRQRGVRHTPPGVVNDSEVIRELFESAIIQRGRFEMQFHGATGRRSTYCTAVAVHRSSLTLECSLLRSVPDSWKGREVDCYFRTQQNRVQIYYQFTARVLGSHRAPSADPNTPRGPYGGDAPVWLLDLAIPEKLERRQKRAFLRLEVPAHLVLGLYAWPVGSSAPPPTDGRRLGAPLLALPLGEEKPLRGRTAPDGTDMPDMPDMPDGTDMPDMPDDQDSRNWREGQDIPAPLPTGSGQAGKTESGAPQATAADEGAVFPDARNALAVGLMNLSGGGLRILLPRLSARAAMSRGMSLDIGGRFVALLELHDPQHDRRTGFWLQCRIQTRFVTFETRDVELGAQLLAWGYARDEAPHMADWKPLSDEGEAEPLGNWVIRRHLELYRESESDVV